MTRRSLFALLGAAVALPWVPELSFRGKKLEVSAKDWVVPLKTKPPYDFGLGPGRFYTLYWHPMQSAVSSQQWWLLYLQDDAGNLYVPTKQILGDIQQVRTTEPLGCKPGEPRLGFWIADAEFRSEDRLMFKPTPSSDGRAAV